MAIKFCKSASIGGIVGFFIVSPLFNSFSFEILLRSVVGIVLVIGIGFIVGRFFEE